LLPSILIGFDGSRFAAGRGLDTRVQIAKQDARPFFSSAHLAVSRSHKGFARTFSEQPRQEPAHSNSLSGRGSRINLTATPDPPFRDATLRMHQ